MAITYAAGIITITGYTEGTPCNFTDIYNADVAGGWGVVSRQCTDQFCISAHLYVGDGSTATWFKDTLKQVVITTASAKIHVRANANFQLGDKDGDDNVYGGCFLHLIDPQFNAFGSSPYTDVGDVKLYDSSIYWNSFFRLYRGSSQLVELDGCRILKWQGGRFQGTNSYIKDVVIHDCTPYGITTKTPDPEIDNVTVSRSVCAFYCNIAHGPNPLIKNLTSRNNTYAIYIALEGYNHGDPVLVNPEFDSWNIFFSAAAHGATCDLWRKYEFGLKVIDKDNVAINAATVKIWDKDSNLIVDTTTNASGVIATQTITRGYYNQANGNTLQEASPHLIKIEKAGYTTYEADFTLEDKTDWLIALQAAGGGLLRNPPMTGGMV